MWIKSPGFLVKRIAKVGFNLPQKYIIVRQLHEKQGLSEWHQRGIRSHLLLHRSHLLVSRNSNLFFPQDGRR